MNAEGKAQPLTKEDARSLHLGGFSSTLVERCIATVAAADDFKEAWFAEQEAHAKTLKERDALSGAQHALVLEGRRADRALAHAEALAKALEDHGADHCVGCEVPHESGELSKDVLDALARYRAEHPRKP